MATLGKNMLNTKIKNYLGKTILLLAAACGTHTGPFPADGKTKIGADGSILPNSASGWACVRDNKTKLTWEVKTNDHGLRDWNRSYTNYSKSYNLRNGYGSATDASGFVSAVNAIGLCGAKDWRLPTQAELLTLVVKQKVGPAIDTAFFPNTENEGYWSSTPQENNDENAKGVFFDGTPNDTWRFMQLRIRLVRN
jgi:hypothetical protein